MIYILKRGWLLLFFLSQNIYSQLVTTLETFPNGDRDVTIIVDLKLAIDRRKTELLGKTSDIYFWSGASDDENSSAFKYTPAGQSDFNKPFEPGKMTSLGNDKWSIKINPRNYYKVPVGTIIKKIGIVIKNGAGNAQTEDLFLKLYGPGLIVRIIEPMTKPVIAARNEKIPIKIKFSQKSNVMLGVLWEASNGATKTFEFAQFNSVDSISTIIDLSQIKEDINEKILNFSVSATNENGQTLEAFQIVIIPNTEIVSIPIGLKNGLNYNESGLFIAFFAPNKKFIYLIGDFNNWEKKPEYLLKKDPESDRFWIKLSNLETGKEYAYQFLVDGILAVADPFAEKILDSNFDSGISASTYPNLLPYPTKASGIVSVLQTNQKPFEWKISKFERPKSEKLIIYELLIRDFTKEGNYKAAQEKLPYLKNLGINAIELMPVSEFTANDSWGYNPTFYLAPDKAYGTKNDLKTFIDECHKLGIAIIIDMVFNQADESFPYVKMYFENGLPSVNSPFFNPTATHPFSVFRDFNHESTATQSLVDQVNKYWLEEFKIDGFRFDLSKGFTQTQNTNVAAWSAYDASRIKIWKRIYDKIREVDKTAYVILEHFADNNEEQELSAYGIMLWGNANGEFRSALKGNTSNFSSLSHQLRSWSKPNLIGYMESHDEERLLYDVQKNGGSNTSYSTKDLNNAIERAKAAAALFLLLEGPKMLWQFGELGYDISIDENGRTGRKPLKWEYFDMPSRKKLYQTYSELTKIKTLLEANSAKYTYQLNGTVKQIQIESSDLKALVIANFSLENRSVPLDISGNYFDYFTGMVVALSRDMIDLKPGEFHIYTSEKLPTPETGIVPWAAFTKDQILAIEPHVNLDFRISPNPVMDELHINFRGKIGEIFDLKLIDISGNSIDFKSGICSQSSVTEIFSTKKLPSGIYFLRVTTEGNSQTGKFLKE